MLIARIDEQCAGASRVVSMVEVENSGLQLVSDYVASFPFSHANYVECSTTLVLLELLRNTPWIFI